MYATFFGLRQEPFSIAPDPRYLFMSERHREALAHLLYGVRGGGGFVLLTGAIGAGKTTVCRCFLEQIPKRCNVAYIFNPKLTVTELLQSVCDEFRIPQPASDGHEPTVKAYLDPINEFLLRTHAVGQNNVLIIDEAQNLSADVLEQLRLLTNLETSERKLLQIVLIGQPELREMLARPDMEQLAQRVIARYHLDALSEGETAKYVRHRMTVAGLAGPLPFDRAALRQVHQLARGVPRRINLLCDRAMLGAYGRSQAQVTGAIVEQAAREVFGLAEPEAAGWRPLLRSPWAWAGFGVGVAGGLALGLGLLALATPAPPAPPLAAAPPAAMAAAAAAAAASRSVYAWTPPATVAAAAPDPLRTTPLRETFANPLTDEAAAWRQLFPLWGLPAPAPGDEPCASARRLQMQCFRDPAASLTQIRLLDRPGIIALREGDERPLYALLVGLDGQRAMLQVGDGLREMSLPWLATMWHGEFATLWRTPAGLEAPLAAGAEGPAVNELAERLARATGRPKPTRPSKLDAALRARVQAFQVANGLRADGLPGPETFMQLNRATGVDEPRLSGGR